MQGSKVRIPTGTGVGSVLMVMVMVAAGCTAGGSSSSRDAWRSRAAATLLDLVQISPPVPSPGTVERESNAVALTDSLIALAATPVDDDQRRAFAEATTHINSAGGLVIATGYDPLFASRLLATLVPRLDPDHTSFTPEVAGAMARASAARIATAKDDLIAVRELVLLDALAASFADQAEVVDARDAVAHSSVVARVCLSTTTAIDATAAPDLDLVDTAVALATSPEARCPLPAGLAPEADRLAADLVSGSAAVPVEAQLHQLAVLALWPGWVEDHPVLAIQARDVAARVLTEPVRAHTSILQVELSKIRAFLEPTRRHWPAFPVPAEVESAARRMLRWQGALAKGGDGTFASSITMTVLVDGLRMVQDTGQPGQYTQMVSQLSVLTDRTSVAAGPLVVALDGSDPALQAQPPPPSQAPLVTWTSFVLWNRPACGAMSAPDVARLSRPDASGPQLAPEPVLLAAMPTILARLAECGQASPDVLDQWRTWLDGPDTTLSDVQRAWVRAEWSCQAGDQPKSARLAASARQWGEDIEPGPRFDPLDLYAALRLHLLATSGCGPPVWSDGVLRS